MMRHAAAMLCRSSLVSLVSEGGPPWESTNPAASGDTFTLVDVGDLG
jgi:hypothetical protein